MRNGLFGSIAALAAGAGLAWGQAPAPWPDSPPPALMLTGGGPVPVPSYPAAPPPLPTATGQPVPAVPMSPYGGAPNFAPIDSGHLPQLPSGEEVYEYNAGSHFYLTGEYLLWFVKGQPVPVPLITSSGPQDRGIFGQPSTVVLVGGTTARYGGDEVGYNEISGARITGGLFLDSCKRWGIELSGFVLENKPVTYQFGSDEQGIGLYARPGTNAVTAEPLSLLVSFPGYAFGGVKFRTNSQTWGAEGSLLLNLYRGTNTGKTNFNLNLLMGPRYFEVSELVSIKQNSFLLRSNQGLLTNLAGVPIYPTPPYVPPVDIYDPSQNFISGTLISGEVGVTVSDKFKTTNNFYGGQVGLQAEFRYCRWVTNVAAKLAIGVVHQQLDIDGSTTFNGFATDQNSNGQTVQPVAIAPTFGSTTIPRRGGTVPIGFVPVAPFGLFDITTNPTLTGSYPSGFLAGPQNIGRYTNDEYAYIPELTFNLGYQVTSCLTAFVGYNTLYLSKVVRPGNALNAVVNPVAVPANGAYGVGDPSVIVVPTNYFDKQEKFWVQGVNFGLNFKY